jgi:hypothetical protein
MGTKARQQQRKQAARKQEQHQREARARREAHAPRSLSALAGLAADLNEQQEAETQALTTDVIARLYQLEGIPPAVASQMHAAGMRWSPDRKSFVGGWEAGP